MSNGVQGEQRESGAVESEAGHRDDAGPADSPTPTPAKAAKKTPAGRTPAKKAPAAKATPRKAAAKATPAKATPAKAARPARSRPASGAGLDAGEAAETPVGAEAADASGATGAGGSSGAAVTGPDVSTASAEDDAAEGAATEVDTSTDAETVAAKINDAKLAADAALADSPTTTDANAERGAAATEAATTADGDAEVDADAVTTADPDADTATTADADAEAATAADADVVTTTDADAEAATAADADVVTTTDGDADTDTDTDAATDADAEGDADAGGDAATADATAAGGEAGTKKGTASKAATKAAASKAGPAKKAPPTKKVAANKGGRNSEPAALTKPEKRALAKQLAAKRAAAQRRRRVGGYLITFVLIAGIIAAVFIGLNWKTKKDNTPAPKPSAAAFPVLPEGTDPALKTKPDVKAGTGTPSKLVVTPLVDGKGPATTSGQTLTVNYVGVKYATGEEFDSSWSRSQTLDFQLGGQVIQGWNQGLLNVKVGSRLQLDIPANLAYGDKDDGSGKPFGPLRFVVDVLAAK